jgi:hypothetical protein
MQVAVRTIHKPNAVFVDIADIFFPAVSPANTFLLGAARLKGAEMML